jgi:hypothetical protein
MGAARPKAGVRLCSDVPSFLQCVRLRGRLLARSVTGHACPEQQILMLNFIQIGSHSHYASVHLVSNNSWQPFFYTFPHRPMQCMGDAIPHRETVPPFIGQDRRTGLST